MEIKSVDIGKCKLWNKNPRSIKKEDYDRLKKHISELGEYKPLVGYKEGAYYIILGGNMRLRIYKDLKKHHVMLAVIKPKNEEEKIKIALSDNDNVGYYDEGKLAELIYPLRNKVKLSDFKINLSPPKIDLVNLLNRVAEPEEPEGKAKTKFITVCPKCGHEFQKGKKHGDG